MTAKEISDLFASLELELIASLKRNLARHKRQEQREGGIDGTPEHWEAWQAAKLRDIYRFRKENEEILGGFTPQIDEETRQFLHEQFAEGGSQGFFKSEDERLQALIHEIQHNEGRVERASLRYMDDVYRKTILRTATALSAGGMTLQQATDSATKDFLAQGINCVEYANGRLVNIASYAEMALRTSGTRAMLLGEAKKREAMGVDTVLVSQYGACSDTCLPWQGKVYIDDVFQEYRGPRGGSFGISRNGHQYMFLSVAMRAGLFHPNCRHTITTWIEGVSRRPKPMDIAEIERVNKLEAKQRRLEREARRARREAEGLTDPKAAQEAKHRWHERQRILREFMQENGDVLRRDYWRERDDKVPDDYGNASEWDNQQYWNYRERLGARMPEGGFSEFLHIKRADGDAWNNLQEDYRYTGIVDRILEKVPDAVVCSDANDIPSEYHDGVTHLAPDQKDGLYHYTHYPEGVRMNKYLGGVPGVVLSDEELRNMGNAADALRRMGLPNNTVLWRGTDSKLLKGFEHLDPKNLQSWKRKELSMDGFVSSSILRSSSYNDKPVQMVILAPKDIYGAGYISDISYNMKHLGEEENGYDLKNEHEVLLQNGSRFDIIEAQILNGRTIIVVQWKG